MKFFDNFNFLEIYRKNNLLKFHSYITRSTKPLSKILSLILINISTLYFYIPLVSKGICEPLHLILTSTYSIWHMIIAIHILLGYIHMTKVLRFK